LLLYDSLLDSDWSCVLHENSVDSAVNNLTATVSKAIDLAIPFVKANISTYPHWFSKLPKYYIKKNQFFKKFKKSKSNHHYSLFSYYRKLVKTTIKTDRLAWLKTIDDNLRTEP
jgi:hypothetical protein